MPSLKLACQCIVGDQSSVSIQETIVRLDFDLLFVDAYAFWIYFC